MGTEPPPFVGKHVGLFLGVADDDVVKDASGLHLPEIEAAEAEVVVFVNAVVTLVLGIVDLPRLPEALVG